MMKTITGKFDQKSTEGHWLGYSGTSKRHRIYGANKVISVKQNITFDNAVLMVPDAISIVEEDKQESIQKTSKKNTMVQSPRKEPKPLKPLADIITRDPSVRPDSSASKTVDDIVKDLENAPSQ